MLQWLCDSLDLPMLAERADGTVEASGSAASRIAGRAGGSLVTHVRHVVGDQVDTDRVAELVLAARRGTPGQLEGPRGDRILFGQVAPGRAVAVIAPADLAQSATLRQRAAAADQVAGVSHELANALGAIAGWAHLARGGQRVDEALELIEDSANTAWSAARHMLGALGGPSAEPNGPMDLSKFVRDTGRLLGPKAMQQNVFVQSDVQDNVIVTANRGALWTVVWNLATNAVEAMPEGGTVQLSLAGADGMAHLTITDDGPGMPRAVQDRIFEPYFTTKGTGTGLGLAMVRDTVEGLGGQLSLQSEVGHGTRFDVTLPLSNEVARASQLPLHKSGKRSSGVFLAEQLQGRFLLVEDDASLREMVSTALQMRGAEVVAVDTCEAARAQQGPFIVAMVDLLLPDCRGDQLIADLRQQGVIQYAVLTTGTELPEQVAPNGLPDAVLRKPFELDALFERLHELLARDGNRRAPASHVF